MGVSQTGKSLLDNIVDFIIPPNVVSFLNTSILRLPFFILNYWSFVHLFSGVLFFFIKRDGFRLWVIINIVFEVLEYILGLGGNPLFVEEFVDSFWDIMFSLSGFLLMQFIFKRFRKKK